jgi:hypothetical protein
VQFTPLLAICQAQNKNKFRFFENSIAALPLPAHKGGLRRLVLLVRHGFSTSLLSLSFSPSQLHDHTKIQTALR